jgi:hypothetical protein
MSEMKDIMQTIASTVANLSRNTSPAPEDQEQFFPEDIDPDYQYSDDENMNAEYNASNGNGY